jgi:spermidine synthase
VLERLEETLIAAPKMKENPATGGSSRAGGVRLTILALFFLSGACGLIYEVAWMRMLTLVFGATAFATSTILASFFSGLALGSFTFGRVIDRGRSPLKVYALLEAGIGIFAFLMPLLLSGLTEFYVGLSHRFAIPYYQFSLIRFSLSFLVLLVPATLMGGTLPVLIKFFVQGLGRLGWHVGRLYAVNTLGAVVGTVAAGFFLILFLGVHEAAYVAGAVNLLIAGVVLVLDRRTGDSSVVGNDQQERVTEQVDSSKDTYSPRIIRLALWAAGLSGFCALALEVLWTRSLVYFLDNSTHAFSTMLTAFLFGIAIGSFLIARLVDTRTKLLVWLGFIQLLIGIFAVLAIPILANATPVIQRMAEGSLGPMLTWRWIGMRFVTSLTVMLVPTVLMGMAFPLVTKIYARSLSNVGAALGNVYSANTMGGVLGSFMAGFVLIPLIGMHHAIILVAAVNVALGAALVLSEPSLLLKVRLSAVAGLTIVFLGLGAYYVTKGAVPLASYYERMEATEVLSYEEGLGATVKVFVDSHGDKLLSIDGFPVAGTTLGMHDAQQSLAQVPLLLSSVPSPRVNIIGFGTGGTSWGILQYDVEEIDCVELVSGVINAAKWFPEVNHDVLSEPRFNLILGDGRNYALMSQKSYDIISIDATSPKMAGNGSLYALEFYQLLRERLSEDGLAVQWLPIHLLSDAEVRMTAKTFQTVFPHTTLWLSPLRHHGVLVGTRKPLEIDLRSLRAKLEREGVQQEMERFNVRDVQDFLSWFVMGEEALARYSEGARMNTDGHPYLEFTPAMAFFRAQEYQVRNLASLREHRESVFPLLSMVGETQEEVAAFAESVQKRFEATQHSIAGDVFLALGMRQEARDEYNQARAIDPDDLNWMNPAWITGIPEG